MFAKIVIPNGFDFYVPAIVIALPNQDVAQNKFYTVLKCNNQRVSGFSVKKGLSHTAESGFFPPSLSFGLLPGPAICLGSVTDCLALPTPGASAPCGWILPTLQHRICPQGGLWGSHSGCARRGGCPCSPYTTTLPHFPTATQPAPALGSPARPPHVFPKSFRGHLYEFPNLVIQSACLMSLRKHSSH